jgi:hypothetical protein
VADSGQLAGAETTLERFPEIDILVNNRHLRAGGIFRGDRRIVAADIRG